MTKADADKWGQSLGQLKKVMDVWFVDHPKIERRHQQLLVDQNNRLKGSAKTDFFILDIEYANKRDRFDMIAMSWPGDAAQGDPRLVFMEFKVGDNELRSASSKTGEKTLRRIPGIAEHFGDFTRFITPANYASVQEEMMILKQKIELDVLCHSEKLSMIGKLEKFSDVKPLFIFVIANHNPKSAILLEEIQKIDDSEFCDVRCVLLKYKKYGILIKSILNLAAAKAEISRRLNA